MNKFWSWLLKLAFKGLTTLDKNGDGKVTMTVAYDLETKKLDKPKFN